MALDLSELHQDELLAYAAGYADAIEDASDRCRRDAEAPAELETELAAARADADYWRRVANPTLVVAGPSHAELEQQRHVQMIANASNTITPWDDVPTRRPGHSGAVS